MRFFGDCRKGAIPCGLCQRAEGEDYEVITHGELANGRPAYGTLQFHGEEPGVLPRLVAKSWLRVFRSRRRESLEGMEQLSGGFLFIAIRGRPAMVDQALSFLGIGLRD